ncbi:hypothetical protein Teth39_0752 [Thermoanaerobacter pseudethanolicus ATCC 33223]|uniref:Uncharacterized protein n=1 Tax=Thermoanaerobacter pseudethanolicus (strain ATCC 33223 / 39E) TaxID=340099 RepID=B0K898_THEP3|nr:hypothetical protein Teth39_0752 [Thermoanaerobacter pseudethanolicus ATCC 33223]
MHKERLVTKRQQNLARPRVEAGPKPRMAEAGTKTGMSNVPGTLPEPEGRALVLSLWNIGVTMQNILF